MAENELLLPDQEIVVQDGNVIYNGYQATKEQALALAANIRTVEVTEENVKESKKLLAAVNRGVKQLEDQRILVKKRLLEPYNIFEAQVKEIVAIVKEADDVVRQQVKHLEEAERIEKHGILEELFNKRIIHYTFRNLFNFQHFVKPKHLNKSASVESVEKEMVEFLERIAKDFNAIGKMPDADAILVAYQDHLDLAAAMIQVDQMKQKQKAVVDARAIKEPANIAYLVSIRCQDEKELKLLKLLLENEGFNDFTIDKIL